MKRTFSKEEAQRIFADAAERQQAEARPADEFLTLDELEESAAAAGIDAAYVRAAAERLVKPSATGMQRRMLGVPIESRTSAALSYVVDDEAWSRIVVELRSVFGKRGIATEVGSIREWASDAGEQHSPVRVTTEPEGGATRVTIERSTWSRALGLGGGTSSILLTALILGSIALATGTSDLFFVVFVMATLGLLLGAGFFAGTRIAARGDERRFQEAVRRIRDIGAQQPSAAQESTHQRTAHPLESPSLTIEDEPVPSSPEQAPRRRDRER